MADLPAATNIPEALPRPAADLRQRLVDFVHGPIISSSDLDAHLALFGAFGMVEVGRVSRPANEVRAIWDIDGQACEEITLETPGTRFGARLVRFDPGIDETIRTAERGQDYDALKVIDFYAPDLEAARLHIESRGFRFKHEVAEYDTPEGHFREAHVWALDGVVCALISGSPEFFRKFATVRDRLVSEPQSISGPVRDPDATLEFFSNRFGLQPLHTYGVHDDSFSALVGTASEMHLRAWNVGRRLHEPYFGIIDYGLPNGAQVSLFDHAKPPVRGLLGATLVVPHVDVIARLADGHRSIGPIDTQISGLGAVRLLTLRGPNGGWYQAVQSLDPRRQ